tara:strand:+ start:74 stop:538 length:465 start_codon:yes stop_codon:yes gene_type:complete
MSNTSRISEEDGIVLEMSRHLKAPRQRVFDAWSNLDALKQWFGPEGCVVAEGRIDFQVGGNYRLEVETPDSGRVAVGGTYTEIDQPGLIAFTWKWDHSQDEEMQVRIDLLETSETETELRLTQTNFPDRETAEHHTQGWGGSFDKLAPLAEAST